MKTMLCLLIFLFTVTETCAAPAWYHGKITRIWHYSDDGFILTFDSGSLDDCKHKYVYFKKNEIGENQEKSTYSMALSAFHTQQRVGVVIDKSLNGEYCNGMNQRGHV